MKANNAMTQEFLINPEGPQRIALEADISAEYVVLLNAASTAPRETSWDITLAEGASLKMVFLSLDGSMVNRLSVALCGGRASCDLSGLCLARGEQRMDFDIRLTHLVPDCHSTQLFKNVLDDRSVTHFDGLVKVVPDAQRTEAYQANHNLLLSDAAHAFTRPQLEIYADDVKCSHGATIGRLNPDELFYLRSRGITLAEARLLQLLAFAGEVVEKISTTELRARMQDLVEKRLRGAS